VLILTAFQSIAAWKREIVQSHRGRRTISLRTLTAPVHERTRAVFDRYNIVSESDLRAAVKRTSEYIEALPSTPTVVPLPGITRRAE